jgi:hypothetical protein
VEFPFIDLSISLPSEIRPSFPAHEPAPLAAPVSFTHPLFGLRGPPAAC